MSSRPSRGAARLAAILDALPDALLLVNCNGTVVNANTIALETFESPGTGLVGRGLLDLLPSFDSKLIPGSMRRPDNTDEQGRTKPTRMIARRTDGSEFPVEVTSANLEDGRDAYSDTHSYTGDELLMLVVRDLSGTVDTEAELARSQRQTEMILRAAAEGVIGTDTEGRVVLVNPAAAQILGHRASDLGNQELHPLAIHSRPDGTPFPFEESPLADTLRSGRKHRVRGQVLWAKNGQPVSVDLTTSPVRDGDQLVGAVMTFTDRRPYDALAARHAQLLAVLGDALRGPLEELRGELSTLAADDAGQLWPEANQLLHHLAAGYARMTTLVDNVLGFQRLDSGAEKLSKKKVLLDGVVAAGVEGAIELIGPGRAQFAVHAPTIEAEVDAGRIATALAHLIADVAGVDSTGKAPVAAGGGGYMDSTIVVAAAQRGEVVRIEVRGPYAGGDPVHEPIVRGIVRAHGGVLQTHEVPGTTGSAFVLDVPLGAGAGMVTVPAPAEVPAVAAAEPAAEPTGRRARRSSVDAFLDNPDVATGQGAAADSGDAATAAPSGARPAGHDGEQQLVPAQNAGEDAGGNGAGSGRGTGRRRGRPSPVEQQAAQPPPHEGAVVTAAEGARDHGRARLGETVPPQGVPAPTGRRARRGPDAAPENALALPAAPPAVAAQPHVQPQPQPQPTESVQVHPQPQPTGRRARRALGTAPERSPFALPPADADRMPPSAGAADASLPGRHDAVRGVAGDDHTPPQPHPVPTGRRRARTDGTSEQGLAALAADPSAGAPPAPVAPEAVPQAPLPPGAPGAPAGLVVPPASPDAPQAPAAPTAPKVSPAQAAPTAPGTTTGHHPALASPAVTTAPGSEAAPGVPHGPAAPDAADTSAGHDTSGQNWPVPGVQAWPAPAPEAPATRSQVQSPLQDPAPKPVSNPAQGQVPGARTAPENGREPGSVPQPRAAAQPLPEESPVPGADASQGRAFSVRTLGQGMPFAQQIAQQQNQTSGGSGRRRKLAAPPQEEPGHQAALLEPAATRRSPQQQAPQQAQQQAQAQPTAQQSPAQSQQQRLPAPAEGRAYAIGAPDEGAAEGPEPLDGPNGAVEVANRPHPQPVDDELPPEPLDNPRRLLVWPAPDVSTQQALSDRGYRPVIVHSREEVDAQIAAFPAALFVDPLTGPITRTALQSLRQAAVAAEVPVLVTAGLGQATREAAYGADPAVLLKALAPRDSEQHPPRVLLIEEHEEIALALTATLERRGMQVARADADTDAVTLATQMRPNLVVMDLMQVRRRRAGIVDWLRANGQLNRTPLVVYTSVDIDRSELPRLSSGETVLFLAERSNSAEVQGRIVDLLAKIGTN
ncbi:PAS domain-containing protein [Streptomyces sp. NPDC051219]|uniref:PAS domain-containing protein n=1 Tax=Streptomyces sp. NPDC051219 TaxID=3155283 RepID=UPI0034337465